jgi:hypothetical protein
LVFLVVPGAQLSEGWERRSIKGRGRGDVAATMAIDYLEAGWRWQIQHLLHCSSSGNFNITRFSSSGRFFQKNRIEPAY